MSRSARGAGHGLARSAGSGAAALLIILGVLLAPAALVARWVQVNVSDQERYLALGADVPSDPGVRAAARDQLVVVVLDLVDPERGALAEVIGPVLADAADAVLASDAAADFWTDFNRSAHAELTGRPAPEPDVVDLADDGTVDLRPASLVARLTEGITVFGLDLEIRIPPETSVELLVSPELVQVRRAYPLLDAAGEWLPWVSAGLIGLGVLLAARRARALTLAALAVAGLGVLALLALRSATGQAIAALPGEPLGLELARVLGDAVVESLTGWFVRLAIGAGAVFVAGGLLGAITARRGR